MKAARRYWRSLQIIGKCGIIVWFIAMITMMYACPRKTFDQLVLPKEKAFQLDATKQGYPRWIFLASERIVSTPAVGLNTIYIGSLDRKLFAVDSRTGKKKWTFDKMDDLVLSSPATTAAGDTIYIASRDNNLYAVRDTGFKKWEFPTQGPIDSSPKVGIDGTIYVASHDARLYALPPDPPAGQRRPVPKWIYQGTEKFQRSSPEFSAAGDVIYIGSLDGSLHAVPTQQSSNRAKAQWVRKICDKITSSPKTDTDGTIYVGCWGRYPQKEATDKQKGELKAVNPDGSLKWSFPTDGPILSSPQIGRKGKIFIGSDDTYFYAIDRKGEKVWSFQSGKYQEAKKKGEERKRLDGSEAYIQASAALSPQNGNIYFGSINEYLYALSPEGKLLWQFDARGWVDNAPVIHGKGDIIYVVAGNRLFAMNP